MAITIRDFYESLTPTQKQRVEEKLNRMLKVENQITLDESRVHIMRCQIASDMYQILKG